MLNFDKQFHSCLTIGKHISSGSSHLHIVEGILHFKGLLCICKHSILQFVYSIKLQLINWLLYKVNVCKTGDLIVWLGKVFSLFFHKDITSKFGKFKIDNGIYSNLLLFKDKYCNADNRSIDCGKYVNLLPAIINDFNLVNRPIFEGIHINLLQINLNVFKLVKLHISEGNQVNLLKDNSRCSKFVK